MAMTINGTNGVTFNDGTSMSTGQQACKAWVNFNGTGTVAIRAAFNVSSITDNGTADYTVNFTTAMVDANYAVASIGAQSQRNNYAITYSSNSFRIGTENYAVTKFDEANMSLVIFR